MSSVCFFNVQASNLLQHVAVVLEISAIYLVYRDRKIFDADIGRHWGASMVVLLWPSRCINSQRNTWDADYGG